MIPNTWVIFKKAGLFRWEFVKYFPDPKFPRPMFIVPDIGQELIMLSEGDERRRYRASLLGESSYLETYIKTIVTPFSVTKEVRIRAK